MLLAFINAAFAITGCEQCRMPGQTYASPRQATHLPRPPHAASFCCPTGASCFKCKSGRYRCYAGPSNPACTICDDGDDPRPQCNTNFGNPNLYDTMMVVFGVVLVCGLCACMNRNSMQQPTYYAQPVATAAVYSVGNQMHYATPYRQYGGYSGGTVAGSAGAGWRLARRRGHRRRGPPSPPSPSPRRRLGRRRRRLGRRWWRRRRQLRLFGRQLRA